jgi:hypothetical protein
LRGGRGVTHRSQSPGKLAIGDVGTTVRAHAAAAIGVVAVAALHATGAHPASVGVPVYALEIVRAGATTRASCSLIARHDTSRWSVLYFATAARLFTALAGEAPITSVTIDPQGRRITVSSDDVILPTGLTTGISLLRAAIESIDWQPAALTLDAPTAGEPFTIRTMAGDAAFTVAAQHAGFVSAWLRGGSDDPSPLRDCVGAAAVAGGRPFGVVTNCRTGEAPIVSLFSAAQAFFDRHVRATRVTTPPSRRDLR